MGKVYQICWWKQWLGIVVLVTGFCVVYSQVPSHRQGKTTSLHYLPTSDKRIDLELATDSLVAAHSEWEKSWRKRKPRTLMGKIWKPFWLAYKVLFSSQLQRHCFYVPSCSAFPFVAWHRHGAIAFFLIVDRYFRCNPLAVQDAMRWNPWLGERLRW